MITFNALKGEVRRLAEEHPSFQYKEQATELNFHEGCSYLGQSLAEPDKGQGCIMGQALVNLGVSREELKRFEGVGVGTILRDSEVMEAPYDDVSTSEDRYSEYMWLTLVQHHQDEGDDWATAVENAGTRYQSI